MSARSELLDSVIEYAGVNGIAQLSLRRIATGAGTSHRMLIHHFGSKNDLLIAVVREVERRQREFAQELLAADSIDVWELWTRFSDPGMAAFERLFFELYAQALQGQTWAQPLLDGVVDDWIGLVTAALRTVSGTADEHDARLAVAVTRGLLLDLLATGDRDAVDAAMRRFIDAQYRFGDPG